MDFVILSSPFLRFIKKKSRIDFPPNIEVMSYRIALHFNRGSLQTVVARQQNYATPESSMRKSFSHQVSVAKVCKQIISHLKLYKKVDLLVR